MFRKSVSFILIVLIILVLNGCGRVSKKEKEKIIEETIPTISVILLGNHANFYEPDYKNIETIASKSYHSFGYPLFVLIDGNPKEIKDEEVLLGYYSIEESQKEFLLNKPNWETRISGNLSKVIKSINLLTANSDEVDIIEAINVACDLFNSTDFSGEMNKNIYIYDSGVSTKGIIDFTKRDFLNYDSEEIVDFLDKYNNINELPDLSGVNVEWFGLGVVDLPQKSLTRGTKSKLEAFWNSVITYCNGTIDFKSYFPSKSIITKYNVTPITFDIDDDEVEIPQEVIDAVYSIYFKSKVSIYKNEKDANDTLFQVSELIKKYNSRWYIIGCEAGKTTDGINELGNHISTKRAIRVRNDLLLFDVDYDQLIVCSLGPHDPWHIEDYEGDNWIDELAEGNRRVFIINEENKIIDEYKNIIDSGIID